jgi:site-specific DNA-methyltransferase (adenine-specific)
MSNNPPKNIFLNADCMDPDVGLPSYPDNHFDLAIVDPPYGIGAGKMKMNNSNHKFKEWDSEVPTDDYFKELERVSKNRIIWGGNYFPLPPHKCFIVWDKKQPEGVSFSMAEQAWTSFDTVPKVFYQFPSHVTQGKKIHPTQKPSRLYRWLLQNYAKPGDLILDTHVGSASSLIACESMGFNYVGYELDPDYYAAAQNRMGKGIQLQML